MKWWLPLTRVTVKPTLSRTLTTLAAGMAGMVLGTKLQAIRNQATLSVNVNSSGIPTSSMRSLRPARRSVIASSCVGPLPNAATPGRS